MYRMYLDVCSSGCLRTDEGRYLRRESAAVVSAAKAAGMLLLSFFPSHDLTSSRSVCLWQPAPEVESHGLARETQQHQNLAD
jgi:hypothetical protein